MITQITASNAKNYSELFDDANKAVKNISGLELSDSFSITDLESYFSVIRDLAGIVDSEGNPIGRKYTILPLDEGYFEINANDRKITIPPEFKKNGIAVQGDEVAEIVYFSINRFFDHTDLNECEIYIQWEHSGTGEKGVSKEWVRDIESKPDYLIFGWPLDGDITETAGTINFSIRFILWNEANPKTIDYSFSTLNAVATINPALDYEIDELLLATEDVNNRIAGRIRNSEVINTNDVAAEPYFVISIAGLKKDLDSTTGTYTFKVLGRASDAGALSYRWSDASTNALLDSSIEYVAVEGNEEVSVDGRYYVLSGSGESGYDQIVIDSTTYPLIQDYLDANNDIKTIYQKYSVCTVDKVGKYYVTLSNMVGQKTESVSNKLNPAIVPSPDVITFNDSVLERKIINNEETLELQPSFSIVDGNTCSYQWIKDEKEIEGENENTIQLIGDFDNTDIQGYYQLQVTSLRNKETRIDPSIDDNGETPDYNKYCHLVTYPPSNIKAVEFDTESAIVGNTVSIKSIEYINDYHIKDRDTNSSLNYCTYQWQKNVAKEFVDISASEEPDAITETYTTKTANTVRCKVTNHYNGEVSDVFITNAIQVSIS